MAASGWLKQTLDITNLTGEQVSGPPELVAADILSNLSHGGRNHGAANLSPVPNWHGLAHNHQPWRQVAAEKAFALAHQEQGTEVLFRSAARLLPAKADSDPHRVKFPTAMFENYRWASSSWRPHLVAAATYSFLGADAPDTPTIRSIREGIP
jgi:hypothetical protein